MNRRHVIIASVCGFFSTLATSVFASSRSSARPIDQPVRRDEQSTVGTTPFNTEAFEEFGCVIMQNSSHGRATKAEQVEDVYRAAFYELFPGLQVRRLPFQDDRVGIVIAPIDTDLSSLFKSQ